MTKNYKKDKTMTKRELIELLKDYSDDTVILVRGHSDGGDYDDCHGVESVSVRAYKEHSWRGKYTADIEYPDTSFLGEQCTINAVVIQ